MTDYIAEEAFNEMIEDVNYIKLIINSSLKLSKKVL